MPFIEDLEWPSAMWQDEDIQSALDAAGYEGPPTPERLKTCFMDYVDAGYWGDLTMDEAQEDVERGVITPDQMIRALRGRRRS